MPTIDDLNNDLALAVRAKNSTDLYGFIVYSIDNLILDTNGNISFSSIIIKISIVQNDESKSPLKAMDIIKQYLPVEKYGMINFAANVHYQ